ncbi:MAG: DUF523 domain-containing protein [Deferribacteres bacterium]|nr:DUF523 domain-containing protein [Deferribacteres bacterium]
MIKIGISSCLLGHPVRYDGEDRREHVLIHALGEYFQLVPVCPEVEYGLPVPREPMRLTGSPAAPRLITISTGVDHTDAMLQWIRGKIEYLSGENLCGFIFKSRSPSCSAGGVEVYSPSGGRNKRAAGIFSRAFMRHFPSVPVEEETGLYTARAREEFIERVIDFSRKQPQGAD